MSPLLLLYFFLYRASVAGRVRVLLREMGTVQLMVAALVTFELPWQLEEGEVYLDSEGTALHGRKMWNDLCFFKWLQMSREVEAGIAVKGLPLVVFICPMGPPNIAPAVDQVFKPMNLWRTFYIETLTLCPDPIGTWPFHCKFQSVQLPKSPLLKQSQ